MLRFTIRDVLWLTVVVALGVGWVADHRQQKAARVDAEAKAIISEAREAEWREINSWLTSALDENRSGFGIPGEWKTPSQRRGDSR